MAGVATTESRTWNALLSTTLANYRPVLHDNIFKDLVVLFWLNQAGKKRKEDGGHRIEETLLYAQNSTAKNYSGYELLDTTPQEGITKAYYDWKQAAVSISISRKEERQNSGKHRLINLLKGKTIQAELTLKDLLNRQLIGDGSSVTTEQNGTSTSNPKHFCGLLHFAQSVPTGNYSVGGVNQLDNSWWQNIAETATTGDWRSGNAGIFQMASIYNRCSQGNDHPDFLLGDRGTYEAYEQMLVPYARYLDKRYGDAGFVNLRYKGAVFTYDEWFDSMDTPQTFATGEGTLLFLNSKYIEWVVDSQSDFITTPFIRPKDQDARTAQILVMGELVCANRRRLGNIFSIAGA